jgi:hypothetical protein
MPSSVMGTVPDAHGIVAEHDRLAMYGDFCKVVSPRKLLSQVASFFVVITRYGKDLLTANLPAVLQNPRFASDAEISEEIENVIGLHCGVQAFEDRLIQLLDTSKRAIAVSDYVFVSEISRATSAVY